MRYASVFDHSGYGVAAERCLQALALCDVDLAWEPLVDTHSGWLRTNDASSAAPALRRLERPPSGDEAVVLHSMPKGWRHIVEELGHPRRVIGHTVWETERLPSRWLGEMAPATELWVPTRWNQATFQRSVDQPVHVVPHVTSSVVRAEPPILIPDDHFVVAMISAWDWRKRPDRTICTFLDAFDADDPVTLVIKTSPRSVSWSHDVRTSTAVAELLAHYQRPASVLLDTSPWTEAQILGLLDRADCVLSMTASEGWALGAFDAACLATPVVITGYGGHVEWLGAEYPGLVPYEMVPVDHPHDEFFEAGMQWAAPNEAAAAEQLRGLFDGTADRLMDRAETLAGELNERYSATSVATILTEVLAAGR